MEKIAELFISGIQENNYLKPELIFFITTSCIQIGTIRCLKAGLSYVHTSHLSPLMHAPNYTQIIAPPEIVLVELGNHKPYFILVIFGPCHILLSVD